MGISESIDTIFNWIKKKKKKKKKKRAAQQQPYGLFYVDKAPVEWTRPDTAYIKRSIIIRVKMVTTVYSS